VDIWRLPGSQALPVVRRTALLAGCGVALLCACSPPIVAPSSSGFLGQWTGAITSGTAGANSLALNVTFENGGPPLTRIAGNWQVISADTRLSGSGTFSGGLTSNVDLALDFSPMTVVCPGQTGGIASKSLLMTLVRNGPRLTGRYVALDCPGGEVTVTRP
jgi:hypothetical protein